MHALKIYPCRPQHETRVRLRQPVPFPINQHIDIETPYSKVRATSIEICGDQ